jgi:RHS repeat-associated protein
MTSSAIGSANTSYVYDGNGNRVMKSTGGTSTTYVYDAMAQLIAEYGTPTDYGTKYISVDHLGSTRLVTDVAQNQETCYDYLPFGEQIASGTDGRTSNCYTSTATPLTQKFTGQEREGTEAASMDFFSARYMSSAQGRFTSADPGGNFVANAADPQSWNMYAYARNNPLTFVDPSGLDYCDSQGYHINSGAVGEEDCYQIGGTWHPENVFVTNVDQYNGGQQTFFSDDWLNQWSAENCGPNSAFSFANTAMIMSSNRPLQRPPVQTLPPFTFQVGVNTNWNLHGPAALSGFTGLTVDSHGHFGTYWGYGGGLAVGAGFSGGVQVSVSNGNSICALGGPFVNMSGTAGYELAGTADYFAGDGDAPGGFVQGGGFTLGVGGGGSASVQITNTYVKPFGHVCDED